MKKTFLSFNYLLFFLFIFLSNFVNAQNNNFPIDSIPNNEIDLSIISLVQSLAPPPHFLKEERDSSNNEFIPFFTEVENYEKALLKAKKSEKPILIYFSGYACINTNKMENNILNNPSIQKFCLKKMEVITLYIDNRKKLKEPIEVINSYSGRKMMLKTIGHKNANFQLEKFHSNSQPSFYIIDENEQILVSFSYSLNLNDFKDFLKTGKDLYYK